MRTCSCGAIVTGRCPRCSPPATHKRTTNERGYDGRWKRLSVRKRTLDPLCERCLEQGRTTPATQVHHIKKIATHPHLRLAWDNLMSVCGPCHEVLEGQGTPQGGR